MKYSPTAAALPQPPGSRNQESQHIWLSVLKAAVLVPPKGVTVIGNINGGGTSRLSWKSHPLQKMKNFGLLPGWYVLTSQDLLTALQMFQNPDQLQDNWLKDEASQTVPVKIGPSS
ncbi:hypothetical protein STEG23_012958 [Scotinomys teguina]